MLDTLCMGCMREIGDAKQCPYCGFSADTPQFAPYLPLRALVGSRYVVGKMLSSGGDGATYIGWDRERKSTVIIREFLPEQHVVRTSEDPTLRIKVGSELLFHDGLADFLELWRKLARLRGMTAMIPVLDIVEDNGTAYAISEYVETISLREFLLKSRTGYLSFEQTRTLLMPVVSTVSKLHALGVYHCGISPNTLRLGRDGKIRLTDFMIPAARVLETGFESELFSGYAAIEQYSREGSVGAWTDVYAFGAVTYRMLIGSIPQEATERVANDKLMIPPKFAETLPAYAVSAIQNAMAIAPDDRTASVDDYREELSGSPKVMVARKEQVKEAVEAVTTDAEEAERRRKEELRREMLRKQEQTRTLLISFGVCLAIGLVALGIYLFVTRTPASEKPADTTAASSELVEVPNFVGQSYSRIQADTVLNERFKFVVEYDYSDTVESDLIISQKTAEGQQVPKGSELTIVVSRGVEYVTLPDVSGMQYDAAVQLLVSRGFKCTRVERENDGSHTAGIVIATTPEAGKDYEHGREIYIQVWGEVPTTQNDSLLGGLVGNLF
ncbi:MAG TPA: PASTA domain-containing protein [Candidatus Fimenecus excrementigallinarum]|uniref:PASTA domain-containing protein n=1 Tax=Candidatus Fimenecus excrementigallinarum TaxID=2840816 RepID=A0A9D1IHF1_9FIRM|nr:PASTA domain-containing protein [Candidatus Fimenecus excrementigallinarum]